MYLHILSWRIGAELVRRMGIDIRETGFITTDKNKSVRRLTPWASYGNIEPAEYDSLPAKNTKNCFSWFPGMKKSFCPPWRISCRFNMDTACVELIFSDGSIIAIDTIAVENEIADNMYQRSELWNTNLGAAAELSFCNSSFFVILLLWSHANRLQPAFRFRYPVLQNAFCHSESSTVHGCADP